MVKSRIVLFMLAGCLIAATAGQASAVTVTFREGGGTGYINLKWDAVSINPPLNTNAADWTDYHLQAADVLPGTEKFYVLMAIKNLLTELPITSSDITSATLYVTGDWGDEETATLYRVTTDWLADPAGENESDTDGRYSDTFNETDWSGGGAFTSADYDTSVMSSFTWPAWMAYNYDTPFDVTVMLKAMYDAAQNYGWCMTDHPSSPHAVEIFILNPADSTPDKNGRLIVEYTDTGTYDLVVDSGTGDGTGIAPGTQVAIAADAAATGDVWVTWIGDVAWVYEPLQMNTILEMPSKNATVTATYATQYTLTVNFGTGDGDYYEDAVVAIDADTPVIGELFDQWTGDTDHVADPALASTTVTMPAANVEVTATYTDDPNTYTLTVNSGTGSGDYTYAAVVAIVADAAPTDMYFDEWWGPPTIYVADIEAASTTVTIPAFDIEITATYTRGAHRAMIRNYYPGGWPVPDTEPQEYGPPETPPVGYSAAVYDDVWVHGPDGPDDANHDETVFLTMAASDYSRSALLAVKDLFTLVPPTSGMEAIKIRKAKLVVYKNIFENGDDWWGSSGTCPSYRVSRLKTDWVYEAAGSNDARVTGEHIDGPGGSLTWASGDISFDDWDTGVNTLIPHRANADRTGLPWPTGMRVPVDATEAIERIYQEGSNYGLVFFAQDPAYPYGDNVGYWVAQRYHDSEAEFDTERPLLVIDYDYIISYSLTVNSGTGSGLYTQGQIVGIAADDPPPAGKHFVDWIGDTDYVADVNASPTTVTMPAQNVEVTATWTDNPPYTLTVNNGSGDGSYPWGSIVQIVADVPVTVDWQFKCWIGDVAAVDDVNAATTDVTMPEANVTVTATYLYSPYGLTINSGKRMSPYPPEPAEVVPIAADVPEIGDVFDKWTGDTATVADVNLMYTTLTMPLSNVEITATYKSDDPKGFVAKFREYDGTNYPVAYTSVPFDDTWLECEPWDEVEYGDSENMVIIDGHTAYDTEVELNEVGLICFKDLFTELPATSGAVPITINSAYLSVWRWMGPQDTPFRVARVTTNWVPDEAGTNEHQVSGLYSDDDPVLTYWVDWMTGFTTADYDGPNELQLYIQREIYNAEQKYDVTYLVQDMYTQAYNYGLCLVGEPDHVSPDPAYEGIRFRTSENGTENYRPVLQVDYQYGIDYTLTVNSGSGSGLHPAGVVVDIDADAPPTDSYFIAWVGDTDYVADTGVPSTSVTMPASNVEVTATYYEPPVGYQLTVNSGSGSGTYDEDEVVPIVANAAPGCESFMEWVGDTDYVTDPTLASTDVTMPAAAVEVTATYGFYKGDVNQDGFCGGTDLDYVLGDWGHSGTEIVNAIADINNDGFVGGTDLDYVLGDWGKGACPP